MDNVINIGLWILAGLCAHYAGTVGKSLMDYDMSFPKKWEHRSTLAIICSPTVGELLLLVFAMATGPVGLIVSLLFLFVVAIVTGICNLKQPLWTICKPKKTD